MAVLSNIAISFASTIYLTFYTFFQTRIIVLKSPVSFMRIIITLFFVGSKLSLHCFLIYSEIYVQKRVLLDKNLNGFVYVGFLHLYRTKNYFMILFLNLSTKSLCVETNPKYMYIYIYQHTGLVNYIILSKVGLMMQHAHLLPCSIGSFPEPFSFSFYFLFNFDHM